MSTSHLFVKRDINALKRQDRKMSNHKNWNKEKIKMKAFTNKHLLQQHFKANDNIFVIVDTRLYNILDVHMLHDTDFTCIDREVTEFTFTYDEVERIEK